MSGRPLVYLDSAASALKPDCVIQAITDLYARDYANIHRGLYDLSQNLTTRFEAVRGRVLRFLGADPDLYQTVFTKNATEAMNLIAQSWGAENLKEGDEILLTQMEHHSSSVPWQLLAERIGFTIKWIPVDDDGDLDLAAMESLLSRRVKYLGVTHISNVLGTVNPVGEIVRRARAVYPEIVIGVDGAQGAVHSVQPLEQFSPDFYTITGHKLYGPNGIGALIGRRDRLAAMPPFLGGGDMIETVSVQGVRVQPPPQRFEAGTPPIAEVIALEAALDFLDEIGMDTIARAEDALREDALARIDARPWLRLTGRAAHKTGILALNIEGVHHADAAMILNKCGVAVRAGHHCCMPLMARFGMEGTLRASIGLYNTEQDLDCLFEALDKAREILA